MMSAMISVRYIPLFRRYLYRAGGIPKRAEDVQANIFRYLLTGTAF